MEHFFSEVLGEDFMDYKRAASKKTLRSHNVCGWEGRREVKAFQMSWTYVKYSGTLECAFRGLYKVKQCAGDKQTVSEARFDC